MKAKWHFPVIVPDWIIESVEEILKSDNLSEVIELHFL